MSQPPLGTLLQLDKPRRDEDAQLTTKPTPAGVLDNIPKSFPHCPAGEPCMPCLLARVGLGPDGKPLKTDPNKLPPMPLSPDEIFALPKAHRDKFLQLLPKDELAKLKASMESAPDSDAKKEALLGVWHAENKDDLLKAVEDSKALLKSKREALLRWNDADKANFQKWFGDTDDHTRKKILERVDNELALADTLKLDSFRPAEPGTSDSTFAYVTPDDKQHKIYIGKAFQGAPATGPDSKAGTLAHEMSHFNDVGKTDDHAYGEAHCSQLAKDHKHDAVENADSFEYFLEH